METPPKWLSIGYWTLFALLPWSVEANFGAWNMQLPAEPLIGGLGIGLICLFWNRVPLLRGLFFNSIFLQISLVFLTWMAISACFSDLPMVSWKYWVVTAGHWWVFAVGISAFPVLWKKSIQAFALSIAGVAIYTLIHYSFYHFRADQAVLAPMPFFPDQTMWSAVVVMVLLLAYLPQGFWAITPAHFTGISPVKQSFSQDSVLKRLRSHLPFLILFAALVCSNCRAAWISMLLAVSFWAFVLIGPKGKWLLSLFFSLAGLFFWGKAAQSLSQDVSSMERINRWHCAFRMAQERPLSGYGPGTFQFQYLPFQQPEEMTRISLQAPISERGSDNYGRGGGAHSEYLKVLAETGFPGFLLLIALLTYTLKIGFFNRSNPAIFPLLLAFLSFWMHGVVNDFLHDGRISALVWGIMAMIVTSQKED